VGLRGWDGTYSLFPLRAEPALSLGQVKVKIFDSVLANIKHFQRLYPAFFLENLYPASHKRERRKCVPSIQSS
jgi:hypothetical protein